MGKSGFLQPKVDSVSLILCWEEFRQPNFDEGGARALCLNVVILE
jgi:hypothetical protein